MRYADRCLSTAVPFFAAFCLAFTGCGGGSSSPATASGGGSSPSAATPVVSSIAPTNVPAGSTAITLTVTGSNFQSDSVIEVDGTKEATSFVNSGELTTTLPASQMASGAQLQVQVLNGSVSSAASSTQQITVTNPPPVVTSLTPPTVGPASSPKIVIGGTGFVPTSVLQLNGSARQTSFVSSTQLSLTLTAADLQTPGSDAITAVNTAPGGGTSKAVQLTVSATPPPPPPPPTLSLTGVTPQQVAYGSPDTHIYLAGAGFDSTAIANWNGQALTTTLVSATQLAATVPAVDFTQVGNANVTVTSTTAQPSPSAAISVAITAPPAPQLTSLSPNSAPLGSKALSIQINGTGFATNSVVQWNGQNVPTTFGNSTNLTASVPGSLQTAPGNATVSVVTPAPGGGVSQSLPFTEYVGIPNNDGLYNPVDGLVYVSVPSSAGPPLGNSIISVDPATGSVGQPLLVGSEPNHLALSSDGTTLFVGLDGAGSVVKVDLRSRTVGASGYLGSKGGIYDAPGTAIALAALPGSATSVAVSGYNDSINGGAIDIFDNGVARKNSSAVGYPGSVEALAADPSQAVLYGVNGGTYGTYTYDQNGVKAGISTALTSSASQLQIENGRAYLNSGQVLDAGTGSLLGTFYFSANTAATGPLVADAGSGKVFVLSGRLPYPNTTPNNIQAFRESDFTSITGGSMPVNVAAQSSFVYPSTSSLWRWGANGLAFRTTNGVYSFRSNIVQDLSQTQADLEVALAVTGAESAGSTLNVTASVTNHGPKAATNVSLTGLLPENTGVASAKASQGSCATSTTLGCNFGTIPSGASVSVTLALVPYFAGPLNLAVNVAGNEADPNQANNSASTSLTIASSNYEPTPVLQAIAPNSAQAGSNETTVTVTGANFSADSTVLWNGASIPTAYVDPSTLTATLSTSQLSTFGWASVAVSSPAANAPNSQALPFTIYDVVHLSANHMLYNPYDRLLYASVNSAATQVTGNSIVTIDPLTGTIGKVVPVGSQPTFMGLSDNGQALYTLLSGTNNVALYRPLSQSVAFSFAPLPPAQTVAIGSPRGIAVMPGTETTIAYDTGDWGGVGIFDIDTNAQSGTLRGHLSGPYTGSGVSFLDATDLYTFDTDSTGASLNHFVVSASGLSGINSFSPYESTLFGFGEFSTPPSFKLKQGLAFANAGGVANPVTNPATQIGIYQPASSYYGVAPLVEPDPSLGDVFFFGAAANGSDGNGTTPAGLFRYDQFSFLPTGFLPLENLSTGTNQNTAIDLVRFATDGLALLTSAGQIYLVRGPFVTPQLLQQNPVPTLSSLSVSSAAHGGGNLSLVVTGGNLAAGATVDWNGSPRTTTRVDATHLSVAIPASDLAAAGTASITITNPATAASNKLSFTID